MTVPEESSAAPGLRELARQDKLRRIRNAAAQLLAERPFSELTMREVARSAQVGEATLFRYVASKEELLLLVAEKRLEALIQSLEENERYRPAPGLTGTGIVKRILELYAARSADYALNPQTIADYVRIGLTPGSPVGASSIDHGDRFIRLVERLIAFGQETGKLRFDWDAHVVAANCHGTYIHEILRSPARGYNPETFLERISERIRPQLEPLIIPAHPRHPSCAEAR